MPYGTSFGINWTPWLRTEDSMTCIISFVDRNYIGFRRITVKTPWARGHLPQIEVDKQDIFGKCLHLSTDAFVEFENAVSLCHFLVTVYGISQSLDLDAGRDQKVSRSGRYRIQGDAL